MVFSETVFPPGKVLYKGLKNISCQTLLKDTRFFYLTEHFGTARDYGNTCKYRTKKTIRLFDLSHANIQKLLKSKYPISEQTRHMLRVALGTGVTIGQQVKAAKAIFGKNAGRLPKPTDKRRGQRLSYTELNKLAFGNLSREFLVPEGYDGYYAAKKRTVFHGGSFHSEIMLNNAYQSIERFTGRGPAVPVVSTRSFAWALPKMFMDFCKGTTRLVRPYGGGLTLFCTGGMAVRLYLQTRRQQMTEKIRKTSDFDFTFAVPRKLKSNSQVASYVFTMRKIMTTHLTAFVRYLNRQYKGINARLRVSSFVRSPYDNPRMQVPGTGRRVYQVISYQIITGKNEVTDLVDTALAVYPGASRAMLHLPFSYKIGIPIQRLRYQLKDSMALLSGSFVHKGLISKRNPITGAVKEKGLKNVARTASLLKIIGQRKKYYKNLVQPSSTVIPLLESISRMNLKQARKNARKVNSALKKIK
jgi:hypothetical protein